MGLEKLRPFSIVIGISLVIILPLSYLMGTLGFLGGLISPPLFVVALIVSLVYIYHGIKDRKFHVYMLYLVFVLIFFSAGMVRDYYSSRETLARLEQYGEIVNRYYEEYKQLPSEDEFAELGIDASCRIREMNNGEFDLHYRNGIFTSDDNRARLRSRP